MSDTAFLEIMNDMIHEQVDEDEPKSYVLGFLFNTYGEVALIKKVRPDWQAGKLNGIGGKIEIGETPLQAMSREFFEETGYPQNDWRNFGILHHAGSNIYMFTAVVHDAHIKTMTDEEVRWWPVGAVQACNFVLSNLRWMVPLAMSGSKEVVMVEDPTPVK